MENINYFKLLGIAGLVGLLSRIFMLYLGNLLDSYSESLNYSMPSYTDIDYMVYSDAANEIYQGTLILKLYTSPIYFIK